MISGKLNPGFRFLTLFLVLVCLFVCSFFQVLCYVMLCYVLILFVCLLCHVWVHQFSFQNEYHAAIFGLNLMSHSIRCDLSIGRHEFKMGTICERFRPKNYRLASTSREISVKIMVICFVERSKNRMWDKNRTSAWARVDRCTLIDSMLKTAGIQQNDTLRSWYLERYR